MKDESTRPVLLGVGLLLTVVLLWQLRDVVMLVGFAALLAYALDPLVGLIERVRLPRLGPIPRGPASAIVMLVLVGLFAWSVALATPRILQEMAHFLEALPGNLDRLAAATQDWGRESGVAAALGAGEIDLRVQAATLLKSIGGPLGMVAARLAGNLGAVIGLAITPVLAFYLLAESDAVQASALRFVPHDAQPRVLKLLDAVDRALRSYVRGQALVCLVMGTVTGAVLAMLHFPVALLLGIVVGVAEVVPFLGAWVAAITIAIAGAGGGLGMAIGGVIAYLVINQVIGVFVTPRLMGRHMKMHPFVVTVSILAGGQLLGAPGAILALPMAAALQSLIAELAPRAAGKGTKSGS